MKKLVWWIIAIVCAVVFVLVIKEWDDENATTWVGQQVQVLKHVGKKASNKVEDVKDLVASGADTLADKAGDVVDGAADTVKEEVGDLGGKVDEVAENVKDGIDDTAEDVKEAIDGEEVPMPDEEVVE